MAIEYISKTFSHSTKICILPNSKGKKSVYTDKISRSGMSVPLSLKVKIHEAIYLMPFSFDVLNWKRIRTAWWCTRIVAAAVEQILVRFSRLHSLNSIFFCHVIHKGHRVTRPLPASLLEAQCHMTRGRRARRIRCDLVARGTLA